MPYGEKIPYVKIKNTKLIGAEGCNDFSYVLTDSTIKAKKGSFSIILQSARGDPHRRPVTTEMMLLAYFSTSTTQHV